MSRPGGLAGSLSVSLGELALFAAVTVALVTRRERELVRAAVPCWIASAVLAWGPVLAGGRRGFSGVGVAVLAGSLVRFLLVAYRPAFGPFRPDGWSLPLTEVGPALGHAAVGAAQAILLVAAVMAGSGAGAGGFGGGTLLTTGPLLVGALAAEYLMLRHRARLERALDASTDRAAFRRQLLRAVCGTFGVFTLGIVSALGAALSWAASDSIRGLQLACGVLLAGLSVVTLLLQTHGKRWLAAVLVGSPALFVVSSAVAVAGLGLAPPPLGEALSWAAAVLGTALALGFVVAVRVLPYAPARP